MHAEHGMVRCKSCKDTGSQERQAAAAPVDDGQAAGRANARAALSDLKTVQDGRRRWGGLALGWILREGHRTCPPEHFLIWATPHPCPTPICCHSAYEL
jgi:hypothetical protein